MAKGQISAELIILLAAVVAIALLLISQLRVTALKGSEQINKTSEKIFTEIEKIDGTAETETRGPSPSNDDVRWLKAYAVPLTRTAFA